MGCYDSSILRPLLGSSSTENNEANNNNSNRNGSAGWFRFWKRKQGYTGMCENGDDEYKVKFRQNRKQKKAESYSKIMSGAVRKVGLLVWKNLLLRRRHYLVTALEILLPTLFALVLVYGRAQVKSKTNENGISSNPLSAVSALINSLPDIFPEIGENELKISCGHNSGVNGKCLVAYAPNSSEVNQVIAELVNTLDATTKNKIEWRGFPSEEEIEKFVASLSFNEVTGGDETLRAAIIFQNGLGPNSADIKYKIRMMDNSLSFPNEIMSSLFPWLQLPGPDRSNAVRYGESGFTAFQFNLDKILINKYAGQQSTNYSVTLQPFPYPPHERNLDFSEFYFIILPNVIIIGFIFIVPSIIRGVVNERETGIKELMKLCGIPNWMHWLAWMINSMLFLSLSVTIVILLFFTDYLNPDAGPILTRSDPFLWWIVLCLYVLSATAFCFFVSSFFHRPTIAITVGIILWLTTYYATSIPLGDSNRYFRLTLFDKMAVAVLPNTALYWALKVMCGFEGRASGAQWSNLFEPLSSTDTLTLGHVIFMFLFDTVLYILLTLYVEAVLPSQYGIRKPWYFIFKPSIWKSSGITMSEKCVNVEMDENESVSKPGFEAEPENRQAGVIIKNLTKKFGRNKIAVEGVSMKMYEGEIFALLGHNGAGKTTAISCCIGMIAPSGGTAIINNYDIRTDLDHVREHLGLCPQQNLLFDDLTVDQNLIFFGRLKGLNATDAKNERAELLKKLQLTEKTNTLAKVLSGGQKRKLSLGISLIGKAKVVFLDEPTSGMDVEARRAIWDLLLAERGQRTIILTTHFMEEADVLGDRIGIMAHGKLQCCGSSMFLKKYYGAGYTLSLSMNDESQEKINGALSIVQEHIPSATLQTESLGTGYSIVIPSESCSTSQFPLLFKDLQMSQDSLGIRTIGMALTTMDEVFIKADEGASDKVDQSIVQDITSPMLSEMTTLNNRGHRNGNGTMENAENSEETKAVTKVRLQGLRLLRSQFEGLVIKRFWYSSRKWKLILTQVTIPVFILIVAIVSGNSQLEAPKAPTALQIELSSYRNPITLYSATDERLGNTFTSFAGPTPKEFKGNSTYSLLNELLRIGEVDLAVYRERHIVAAEFSPNHVKAMYSSIPYHASPLALNLVSNTILRSLNPLQENLKLIVTNHPLQGGFEYLLQALQPDPAFSVTTALMFGALAPIGLALLAASYIVSPLEERLCKGKQLQLMTGVNPIVYWGSSFVWDFLLMLAVVTVMVLCFPIFQKAQTYTSYGGAGVIFLILITYGYSAIPFSYISSLFCGTVAGGFSFVTIIHIATGMILPFVVYILEATPTLSSIADTIRIVGRFFPTFGASLSTMRFVEIALKNSRCSLLPENAEPLLCDPKVTLEPHYRQCCSNCHNFTDTTQCMKPTEYISWTYKRATLAIEGNNEDGVPGIGQDLLYMFLLGLAYQIILILLEFGFIERIAGLIFRTNTEAFQNNSDDQDVEAEAERVHTLVKQGNVGQDALVFENLCKSYGSLAAVANLNFGVHHGECFGLLGVNGAGKTTTFRMLTGDELRSNGNAYATGYNLESNRKQLLANIGYCPQFDGIIGVLSGVENVELFGRLRGVENVSKESEKWFARVGLTDSKNVQCMKYSGGMKRRLSAAMAMVGDPEIVLLDEPTSGVDPVSRREFWKIISSIRESGRAIILTSHSMDEITACCSRLGIMVNGQLQCIGGVQHLKNKFAQGYTLSLKLKANLESDNEELRNVEKEIISKFSPCSLKDKHQTAMQYHIQNTALPWDVLFRTMEDLKTNFQDVIEDYSITETTLEEVFLAFARKQYPNREANISLIKKIITCQFCQ